MSTPKSAPKRIVRLLTSRDGEDIELAFVTESGETIRLLATEDQADRLVDELEDVLNAPDEE